MTLVISSTHNWKESFNSNTFRKGECENWKVWTIYSIDDDNIFAYDCDFVPTSGILMTLHEKKKEVNKWIIYVDMILGLI